MSTAVMSRPKAVDHFNDLENHVIDTSSALELLLLMAGDHLEHKSHEHGLMLYLMREIGTHIEGAQAAIEGMAAKR